MRFIRTAENLFSLPLGFQRVEFLQSSGGAYIDTGCVFQSKNHSTTITFKGLAAGSGGQPYHIFGSNANGNRSGALSGITGNNNYIGIGIGEHGSGSSTERTATPTTPKTMTVVSKSTNKFDWIVDGTKVYSDVSFTGSSLSGISEYIFGINFTSDLTASTTVYHYQAEDNGVIVRDMIPCIDPLGVPCMYDLVGKKPYYNQGTGTFTVGRQVIPVEYLQSSGTQYINTGISTAEGICTEAKFKINAITSTSQVVFGKVGETSGTTSRYWFGAQGSTQKWYYAINNYSATSVNADSDIHTVLLDTVNNVCVLDGSTIATFDNLNPNNETIALFGANYFSGINNPMSGRIYYTKIWNNGIIVRDFIPCKDENNVGFMFDKVSGTCYLNAGTGSFSVGENKYTSKLRLIKDTDGKVRFVQDVLPSAYLPLKYLQSTGTQWIKTGINANSNPKYEINFGIAYTNPSSPTNQYTGADYGGTYGVVNGNFQWSSVPVVANKRYEIRFVNENGTRNGYVDGVAYAGSTYQSNGYRVLLFAAGENADGTSYSTPFSCKLYYFRAFLDGVVVGDFYPALRKSDNKPGMYDRITKQFYVNQGSGSDFNYEI